VIFKPHPFNNITKPFDEVITVNGKVVRLTRNHDKQRPPNPPKSRISLLWLVPHKALSRRSGAKNRAFYQSPPQF
jgi:hypothetical protein